MIAKLRKEKNLTQHELAKALNLSRSTLSLYEINKNTPDIGTLIKIADFFEVSLDYLTERTSIKYLPKKEWLNNHIPKGAIEVLNDPKISDVFNEFSSLSEKDKEAIVTYFYGLKYKKEKKK
ncbi:MAG: hypothetical protein PWP27_810 [Clostridiales bacterium]|jgi:transcriptional regulator with XRE-family HTH domain|nr:hypothetical protein [Clostridiales bacterium]MDK2933000.1 hypothetical protein [Clostridiales bacterium]